MGTYATLKSRIADEVNRTDLTSQIVTSVSRAIEHYASRRFWFNQSRGTGTTVAGSDSVAVSGLRVPDRAWITVHNYGYPLRKRDQDWIEDAALGFSASGQPTDFCMNNTALRLWRTPSDVWTITVTGTFDLSALSADGDANAWTAEAQDLIAARARMLLARDVLLDGDMKAAAEEAEREAYNALIAETTRRLGTGRLQPSC
jgi:hypothetical protein